MLKVILYFLITTPAIYQEGKDKARVKVIKKNLKNNATMKKLITPIILIILFFIALFLRIYGLGHSFYSSDNAVHSFYAFKLLFYSPFDLNIKENLFGQIYAYPYGFNAFIIYLWNSLIGIFGIPLNELAQSVPLVFISSLTVISVFLLVNILVRDESISLYSAAFIGVGYFHVAESKLIERMQMVLPLCFLFFLFYFLILYKDGKRGISGYLCSVFIGLFMVTTNKFIAIIPLLLFSGFVLSESTGLLDKIKNTISFIFRKELLLIPSIVFLPYVLMQIYYSCILGNPMAGFIGKAIGKPKVFNFYFQDCFFYVAENFGLVLTFFLSIGIIYGIKELFKLSRESILFAWSLIFIFPFLFLTPPHATIIRANVIEADTPLLILALIASWRAYIYLKGKNILAGRIIEGLSILILIFVFLISWGMVANNKFHYRFPGSLVSSSYFSYENGAKATGYIIRENIKLDKNIFTNYEPILAQYYFGREKIFCQYDSTPEENLKYLEELISVMDYIILSGFGEDMDIYNNLLKTYNFNHEIKLKLNNKVIVKIFSKPGSDFSPTETDVKRISNLFDTKYANKYNLMKQKLKFPSENKSLI